MGATAKGFPYPEPTDPVANGDLAVKALAQFLEDSNVKTMHVGAFTVNVPAGASTASGTFTFPVGKFAAQPRVVAVVQGTSTYICAVGSISAASVSVTVRHYQNTVGAAAVNIHFVAILLS